MLILYLKILHYFIIENFAAYDRPVMLETGTGPGHLGQILLTNVLNIKKILAILPKQPRQVKMLEKLGKINRLFLHSEKLPWDQGFFFIGPKAFSS